MDSELKVVLVPMIQSLQFLTRSLKDQHEQLAGLKHWRMALIQEMHKVNPNMGLDVQVRWNDLVDRTPPTQDATLLALREAQRSLDSIAELLQK